MTERTNTGDKVRFYRLIRRKTMRQLAAESGCSLDTIWRFENGRSRPNLSTQNRVAHALGVDWWDLVAEPLPERPEDVPDAARSKKPAPSPRPRKKKKGW
jgi:transcriptional regulator with XRE-family HTH domain